MTIRVPLSDIEGAVADQRAELQAFTGEEAERVRDAALAAVTEWRWTRLGAPGIGDVETDLRIGERSPWLDSPPDGEDQYGLDAQGRVRVIRRAIQADLQVVEYSPGRVRSLVVDDGRVQSIDDLQLDGARYVRAVFVGDRGWRLSTFEYEGDLWRSEWLVSFVEDHPHVPGLSVMLRTAGYGHDGRLRAVSTVLEDLSDPDPPAPPQIADGGEEIDVTGARLTAEEEAFADALVAAIVADLGAYPPNGALVRFVLRWFDWSDPAYMTLHALGTEDDYGHESAWRPLEWSNVDRELERAGRVTEQPEVAQTAAALAAVYELVEDIPEEYPTSPAIRAVVRRLPDALSARPLSDHFAVAASHFEAYGMRASLAESNPPAVIEALSARDELPPRD